MSSTPQFEPMFFKTLYKSATPQSSVFEAEYYQPMIASALVEGETHYFVRETHGWFDDKKKEVVNLTTTLSPEEGLRSYNEAMKSLDQQVEHRVSEGFVHLFRINPYKGMEYVYLGKK